MVSGNLRNPSKTAPACSLGDDGDPTEGDTCTYICNTGYVSSDNITRTCGSDGMWDGSEPTRIRKEV